MSIWKHPSTRNMPIQHGQVLLSGRSMMESLPGSSLLGGSLNSPIDLLAVSVSALLGRLKGATSLEGFKSSAPFRRLRCAASLGGFDGP